MLEKLTEAFLSDQSANVDVISSATADSKAYMKAVENALKLAAKTEQKGIERLVFRFPLQNLDAKHGQKYGLDDIMCIINETITDIVTCFIAKTRVHLG